MRGVEIHLKVVIFTQAWIASEFLGTFYVNRMFLPFSVMFTKEKERCVDARSARLRYRNLGNTEPNKDEIRPLTDVYDSRVLPRELTSVFRPNVRRGKKCANRASSGTPVLGRWRRPWEQSSTPHMKLPLIEYGHSLFKSVSSIPDFFVSPPARWQYGHT